jgi:hypothetical protein
MSTAESKLDLLQMIIESEDKSFIMKLTNIARSLKKEKTVDWADDLPPEVLNELIESIEEAENGELGTSNEEMLKAARKDFPNLDI